MSIRILPGLLLALTAIGLMPLEDAHAAGSCSWGGSAGPIRYVANVGSLYIPRDAQVGDPIGPVDQPFTVTGGGLSIHCMTDGLTRLTFNADSAAAPVPGPVPIKNGRRTLGALLQTNIAGVAAQISLGSPYDGITPGYWKISGPDSSVPFSGYIDFNTPFTLQHTLLRGVVTLIKTGPIGKGVQPLDTGHELVKASFSDIPDAFSLALSGSVTQAECTLSANPVSADPVKLGDWSTAQFTGQGDTTDPVPFSIALNSCISDPLPGGTVTTAHIRLEPMAGSTTIDANLGLFSLGSGSTAKGVGIQILGRDATTPVMLNTDVMQGTIPASGGMLLEFNALYYQTGATADVSPGSADASLAFTITYK
ncbi:major type 1 subunit fimbrin (pilin) [Pseudomonas sp. IT-P258]|uniref:fimbrial protein n=1 Tax=Pseudomonas sp. IT-P258 TaxID=3026447 RepID=UPI0039DFC95A